MIDLRPIAAAEPLAVEALLDDAFGSDRHQRTAYRMRAGAVTIPELSFAAFDGRALVGVLQSWPIMLALENGSSEPLVLVGPVAVDPERQRQGIGIALTDHMLSIADAQGRDALVLIGDPEYYDRLFGFTSEHTGHWEVPGPVDRHRLLARLSSSRLHDRKGRLAPAIADITALR